jgi:prepilin-type N-terminal cleavage/methylation domain-containing protein
MRGRFSHIQGFTLIELSIVLVIIGLIVGGVLVGQSLINAATIRAQVTQIEKYNQAANTFFGKYGALPGDITPQAVTQFGFIASPARAGGVGVGDGNGELDGTTDSYLQEGELLFFWEDLSTNSGLIEGGFNSAYGTGGVIREAGVNSCTSIVTCSHYFPYAKISNAAFVYVYSGYANGFPTNCTNGGVGGARNCGPNFFGISVITSYTYGGATTISPALTVSQAYAIDQKIDDGLPTTGNVLAQFLALPYSATPGPGWSTNGSTPGASTCYDTSTGIAAYSISYQSGALMNCGISFRMQAGD